MALAGGDGDERTDHRKDAGAAGRPADLANREVGGGRGRVTKKNTEQTPNKALRRTPAGAMMSRRGRTPSLGRPLGLGIRSSAGIGDCDDRT